MYTPDQSTAYEIWAIGAPQCKNSNGEAETLWISHAHLTLEWLCDGLGQDTISTVDPRNHNEDYEGD
jgi:hypothetical protein